jgi:two-component system sensor histidine kinase VicK
MNKAKSMLKEIDLTFSVDPSNLQAYLDQNKIEIAINNLVSNALKFTPARGSVSVSAYKKRNLLHIEIEDTGIGIPESMQDDLFENNIKYSRKGTGGEAGTGLSLDIVQLYVELHNGTVRVESTENKGTTFFIEIPIEPEIENK